MSKIKWTVVAMVGCAVAAFAHDAQAQAGTLCASDSHSACWRQVTYTNFKDFAVGPGMVCMVGGNSMPTAGSDEYLNPNKYSLNKGNEDVVECHKPQGASGISEQPFYPGHNGVVGAQNRVPDGVYDHGPWGGTPTGAIALYGGPYRDDIAVLTSKQHVYVSPGDRNNFYVGENYKNYWLDRKNINADTGATVCLKGLFSEIPPMTSSWLLYAHGCTGEVYLSAERAYRGWVLLYTDKFQDVAGGYAFFYGLTSAGRIRGSSYRYYSDLPALPSGTPLFVGDGYAISSSGPSSRIYQWSNVTGTWTARNVGYPQATPQSVPGELQQIDNGEDFRGKKGEFFVWQMNHRVYVYSP